LDAEGFYDVLESENRKDFPAEWNAIKVYERLGEADPIVTALETFDSDFMEENALDALWRMGDEAAYDAVLQRAQKRNKRPVEILGKIGNDEATETLHDFIDGDGDPALQKITLRALGEIGSEESVQPVAQRLDADNYEVRSAAARSLGLLGDTRAIDPLADVIEGDEADEVRASAAWALNQIGTERALSVLEDYTDDRAYLVQAEAEKAV
ncbi:MAG: HEAT repeat domain-containing protein, partial [Halosimplex sp.]